MDNTASQNGVKYIANCNATSDKLLCLAQYVGKVEYSTLSTLRTLILLNPLGSKCSSFLEGGGVLLDREVNSLPVFYLDSTVLSRQQNVNWTELDSAGLSRKEFWCIKGASEVSCWTLLDRAGNSNEQHLNSIGLSRKVPRNFDLRESGLLENFLSFP